MMQMTDEQVVTIGIAIVFPIAALIYSNSRVGDVKDVVNTRVSEAKETLRAEIALVRTELKAEIAALRAEIREGFTELKNTLKIHELTHHQ